MTDETQQPIILPDTWWQTPEAASNFANYYQRYSLGLFISANIGGSHRQAIFSGFSLIYQDQVLWMTAGHVIDELNYVLEQYGSQINTMAWFDYTSSIDSGAFPVGHRDFRRYSATENGIDIGFGILEGLDAENILQNPNGTSIKTSSVNLDCDIQPEGHFLIGYPGESGQFMQKQHDNSKTLNTFSIRLVCLPVLKLASLEGNQGVPSVNASNPNTFYGKILDLPTHQLAVPSDIKGMSGGPVFGVSRDESRGFLSKLVAIQSSWFAGSKIIRAEPLHKAIEFIETIL